MSDVSSKPATLNSLVAPWRPWQALVAALLVFVIAQFALGLTLVLVGIDIDGLNTVGTSLVAITGGLLTLFLAWWFAGWFGGQPSANLGLVKPKTNIWPKVGLGLLIFTLVSAFATSLVQRYWTGFDADQEQDLGLGAVVSPLEYATVFILLVVITPVVEEVVFRGILFAGWRRYGFVVAAAVSSGLFGLAHWQPNVAVATIVLGWIMAYLYEKTSSLWAPIALHAAKNALAFALVYILKI